MQFDFWKNMDNNESWVAWHATYVKEVEVICSPTSGGMMPSTPVRTPAKTFELVDVILEFEPFPFLEKTGENIRKYFLSKQDLKGISHDMLSGVTLDGGSDGQKAMRLQEEMEDKVSTCKSHNLQRSVLFSIGMGGTKANSTNVDAYDIMTRHRRLVQMAHQSSYAAKCIHSEQIKAGVPDEEVLEVQGASPTRWNGAYEQARRNHYLEPFLITTVKNYKLKGAVPGAVPQLRNMDNDGSDIGRPLTYRELGLEPAEWATSREIEAGLKMASQITILIEGSSSGEGKVSASQHLLLLCAQPCACRRMCDSVLA